MVFFNCLLATYVSSHEECLFSSLVLCTGWLIEFLVFISSVLYISYILILLSAV